MNKESVNAVKERFMLLMEIELSEMENEASTGVTSGDFGSHLQVLFYRYLAVEYLFGETSKDDEKNGCCGGEGNCDCK